MQDGTIINMVEDEFHRHRFIIEVNVSDDEITMKYFQKYTERGS